MVPKENPAGSVSHHSTPLNPKSWLKNRNSNSSHTAGPSGARRGLDLAEDEVSPPDLGDLDRVYTPGPGHILRYANTLTMTFEERMGTAEVQDLLQIMENRTVVDL